ncbi:MAG: hypothetical protein NC548_53995 [Lachnospiraceae bacterium]|nr:hypothetical protein [Lachnospiraceae bacterium]
MTDEEYTEAARPLVKRWRKKPVVIEAVRWDGSDLAMEALNEVLGLDPLELVDEMKKVRIPTLEGEMLASVGDYIIKGVNGEFYPCKPDIFEKTYESAENS